jgi:predicted PurR-regulated permease PerM
MPPRQGLAPSTRTLLTLASAVVMLAGVHAARGILAPLFLAVVLVILVHPIRYPLERRGWPRWLATTAVIVAAYLILAILIAMLTFAGIRFGQLVTHYLGQLQDAADDVTSWLTSLGLQTSTSDAATHWLQPAQLVSVATTISGAVVGVASAFFVVLAYTIFMAVDAARYESAGETFGATRAGALERVGAFNGGVRRYFVVNATFGAIVAVIDGLALWALGVPAPVVWAILAFVTNFIPNIGFVLGLVPPAIMALVVGGWQLSLVVIALYCVVNVVLQVLVQPKFVSDAVDLSLTLSFVSVLFWTFVIGPLGAILAIPLTILTRALLLEGDPDAAWLRWLSGDQKARDPQPPAEPGEAEPELSASPAPAD